jgi:hypothetical protein
MVFVSLAMEKKAASSGNRQEEKRQRLLAVSKALHPFMVVVVKTFQRSIGFSDGFRFTPHFFNAAIKRF